MRNPKNHKLTALPKTHRNSYQNSHQGIRKGRQKNVVVVEDNSRTLISAGIKTKTATNAVRRVTRQAYTGKRTPEFRKSGKFGNTHHLEATDESGEEECEEYTMFHINAAEREPFRVELQLNGVQTSMEVDTGAAATIINEETYKRIIAGNLVTNRKQL